MATTREPALRRAAVALGDLGDLLPPPPPLELISSGDKHKARLGHLHVRSRVRKATGMRNKSENAISNERMQSHDAARSIDIKLPTPGITTSICPFPRQNVWTTVVLFERPFEPLQIDILGKRLVQLISENPKAAWMKQCLNRTPAVGAAAAAATRTTTAAAAAAETASLSSARTRRPAGAGGLQSRPLVVRARGQPSSLAATVATHPQQQQKWYWTECTLAVTEIVRTQMLVPWEHACQSEKELREYLQDLIESESMPKEDRPQWQLTIIPSISSGGSNGHAGGAASDETAEVAPRSAVIFRHHDWWCQDKCVLDKFWNLLGPSESKDENEAAPTTSGTQQQQQQSLAGMLCKIVDQSKLLQWPACHQARWSAEDRNALTTKVVGHAPSLPPRTRRALLADSEEADNADAAEAAEAEALVQEAGHCPMWCESAPDEKWQSTDVRRRLEAEATVLAKIVIGVFEYQYVVAHRRDELDETATPAASATRASAALAERIHIDWLCSDASANARERQYQRVSVTKNECATLTLDKLVQLLVLRFLFAGESRTYRPTGVATSTITFKTSALSWNAIAAALGSLRGAGPPASGAGSHTSRHPQTGASNNRVLSILQFAPMATNKRGITACLVPAAAAASHATREFNKFTAVPSVAIMCHWDTCRQPAKLIELVESHLTS